MIEEEVQDTNSALKEKLDELEETHVDKKVEEIALVETLEELD